MKSFLKQIEEKFIVIESAEYCDSCNRPKDQCVCKDEEIDDIYEYNDPVLVSLLKEKVKL